MPASDDRVKKLAVALAVELSEDYERTPDVIRISPSDNGDVNVQVRRDNRRDFEVFYANEPSLRK